MPAIGTKVVCKAISTTFSPMKTHAEIAQALRNALAHRRIPQTILKEQAGLSQRTLTKVLSGNEDFRVSTLLALADRLGLELVLVPKDAVRAVDAGPVTPPVVKSRVQLALERTQSRLRKQGEGEK